MSSDSTILEKPTGAAGTLERVDDTTKSSISRVLIALREDIIRVDFDPGSKLPISLLCKKYDASAGAVREALSRLVSEGLVRSEDQKGFRVAPVSAEFLVDIMNIRTFIEVEALRRAIKLGDTDWEAGILAATYKLSKAPLIDAVSALPSDLWRRLHKAYHRSLIAACGSPTLLQTHATLYDQTERYRCLRSKISQIPNGALVRDIVKEHQMITDAVLSRDADAAAAAIENHFNTTVEMLIKSGALE